MQDKAVLDSSIIAAIFFKENSSEEAQKIVKEYNELITVDLAIAELGNVAWKRVVFFNEPDEIISRALEASIDFVTNACSAVAHRELIKDAFEIALADKITVYDSLFIAVSEREKAPLLTLDGTLYSKFKKKRDIVFISGKHSGL